MGPRLAGAEGTGLGIRVTLRLDAPSISTRNDGTARSSGGGGGGSRVTRNVSAPSGPRARESAMAGVSVTRC